MRVISGTVMNPEVVRVTLGAPTGGTRVSRQIIVETSGPWTPDRIYEAWSRYGCRLKEGAELLLSVGKGRR